VHVYSAEYRVAALGNITTHPDHRGRGLATAVTAGCCKHLLESVELIGLNVRADNAAAIRAYEKIGFEVRAVYHEWMMEPKNTSATFPE
jgi:predicted GNAT family acetyltransferase